MVCSLATSPREAEAVDESRFVLCNVLVGEDRTCNKTLFDCLEKLSCELEIF